MWERAELYGWAHISQLTYLQPKYVSYRREQGSALALGFLLPPSETT